MSTRIRKYRSTNVVVLNFTERADSQGDIIPPEADAVFANPVPVIYDHEYDKVVGEAYLMRVGNQLIADLHLVSGMEDESESENLIKSMYPSVSALILTRVGSSVLKLDVKAISLGFGPNVDPYISRIGNNIKRVRKSIP